VCINTPFVAALRRNTHFIALVLTIGLLLFFFSVLLGYFASFPTVDTTLRSDAGLLWFFSDHYSARGVRWLLLTGMVVSACMLWIYRHEYDELFERTREKAIARIELPTISKSKVFCVWSAGDEVVGAFSLLEGLANLPYILLHPLIFAVTVVIFLAFDVWGGDLGCHLQGSWIADAPLRWPAPNFLQPIASMVCGLSVMTLGYAIVLAFATMFSNIVLRLFPVGLNVREFIDTFFVKLIFTPTPVTAQHVEFFDVALPMQFLAHSAAYDNEVTIERIIEWIQLQTPEHCSRMSAFGPKQT
jgi:hypothetical protein